MTADKDEKKQRTANRGLNTRQAAVINSTFVLQFSFDAKLIICTFNPALRQAPKRYRSAK